MSENISLEKNKKHTIEVIIDRLIIRDGIRSRLYEAVELASKLGNGKVLIDVVFQEKMLMFNVF